MREALLQTEQLHGFNLSSEGAHATIRVLLQDELVAILVLDMIDLALARVVLWVDKLEALVQKRQTMFFNHYYL